MEQDTNHLPVQKIFVALSPPDAGSGLMHYNPGRWRTLQVDVAQEGEDARRDLV